MLFLAVSAYFVIRRSTAAHQPFAGLLCQGVSLMLVASP
jgi:hypothetical protein